MATKSECRKCRKRSKCPITTSNHSDIKEIERKICKDFILDKRCQKR